MLSGKQIGLLRDAIGNSFLPDEFIQFMTTEMDFDLYRKVDLRKGLDDIAFDVGLKASKGGFDMALIDALGKEKPHEKTFGRLLYELQLKKDSYSKEPNESVNWNSLEVMVDKGEFVNPTFLIQNIINKKRCVCRIEVSSNGAVQFGTGFLVGPDMVLTNYHVVEKYIEQKESVNSVICRFDYEISADNSSINNGVEVRVIDNGVLAKSKYSVYDVQGSEKLDTVEWPKNQLDYALIKLEKQIGREVLTEVFKLKKEDPDPVRGWISPPENPITPLAGSNMILLQHPNSEPVKIAFGFNKVLGSSSNGTRVRYAINTMKGSSGSPCFDENFNWIALHNIGDPAWNPRYNQGISTTSIINDLEQQGIVLN